MTTIISDELADEMFEELENSDFDDMADDPPLDEEEPFDYDDWDEAWEDNDYEEWDLDAEFDGVEQDINFDYDWGEEDY